MADIAGIVHIVIEDGATWSDDFQVVDADDNPVNIAGAVISFVVKQRIGDGVTAALTMGVGSGVTITDGPNGFFDITIPAATTDALSLPDDKGVYYIDVTVGGVTSRILNGRVTYNRR